MSPALPRGSRVLVFLPPGDWGGLDAHMGLVLLTTLTDASSAVTGGIIQLLAVFLQVIILKGNNEICKMSISFLET